MLIELNDLAQCAHLFQEAFTHYQTVLPLGPVSTPGQTGEPDAPLTFGLMEILVLADLYNTLGKYEQAVHAIRQGCRWMQGRSAQRFWDAIEDDREWDVPVAISSTGTGEGARVVGEGEVQPGMYPLDVNARHRLAVARIKMGDINEGRVRIAGFSVPCQYLFTVHADACEHRPEPGHRRLCRVVQRDRGRIL